MNNINRINWGRGRGFGFRSCLFSIISRLLTHNLRARYAPGRYVPIKFG